MIRAFLAAIALCPAFAFGQAWPQRPVKLIAPYPPGGQTDIGSRWMAEKLAPALGQPLIIENRAGAQGGVGIQAAKNSAPDGYAFVYKNVSNISISPHIVEQLPYDGQRDLTPVTQLGLTVLAMLVPASLNVKSLKEFIAYAKANAATAGAHVASGKLVALAATGPRRWPLLPDLPTFAELGYPLDIAGSNGIHAPAATPRAIVERMSA